MIGNAPNEERKPKNKSLPPARNWNKYAVKQGFIGLFRN